MATGISIEVQGLRELTGHFARYQNEGLHRQRDALLRGMGLRLKEKLAADAPRGRTTPHMADLFAVSAVQGDAASASLTITNSKTVASGGRTYSLLDLVTKGTRPHLIQGHPILAFEGGGQTVFARSVQHPGTRPNNFVQRALEQSGAQATLQQFARRSLASLIGGGGSAE